MKEAWQERISEITGASAKLLNSKGITEGVGRIDYAAVYPRNQAEHTHLMQDLGHQGATVREIPTGTVFRLHNPFETPHGIVNKIRIRIFDPEKTQLGYVDYWVADYLSFREKNVTNGKLLPVKNADGIEMLMTEDEKVVIYFPETPLGRDLGENT
ncbi:MAG: hypothetical protein ACHQT7_01820 [Candidatus Levyibacteriota bacterium]